MNLIALSIHISKEYKVRIARLILVQTDAYTLVVQLSETHSGATETCSYF